MKCCVEGCERDAHYKAAQLCQMHYFRQRRYGTTETVKRGKAKPRQDGVTVSRAGLIWRLRQGWEPSRALFQQRRFA